MWDGGHEPPAGVYRRLKKHIRHTHINDVRIENGTHHYVAAGQGEVPLRAIIGALVAGGYEGYYSFAWEKLWHPEIDTPEQVIPQYPAAMKVYF